MPKSCKTKITNTFDFIEKSKQIHGNNYDYSKMVYKNNKSDIEIICSKHGSFWKNPLEHKNGGNCPKCNETKGEILISYFLDKKGIKYEREKTFKDCRGLKNGYLRFDFYLLDHNFCIEFDGIQHFIAITKYGGNKGLKEIKEHDEIKNIFCSKNNIKLLRIKYNQINEIESIINKNL